MAKNKSKRRVSSNTFKTKKTHIIVSIDKNQKDTFLNLRNDNLKDYNFLKMYRSLVELNLSNSTITDLRVLGNCKNTLKKLDIYDCFKIYRKIKKYPDKINYPEWVVYNNIYKRINFTEIPSFKHLEELRLGGLISCEKLISLNDLKGSISSNLKKLSVINCKNLKDISILKNAPNLAEVNFNDCVNLRNITGLENAFKLLTIRLYNTRVKSIECLSNLKNIKACDLSYTNIIDITPLQKCQNIYWLDVECVKLKNFASFANLITLYGSYNEHLRLIKNTSKIKKINFFCNWRCMQPSDDIVYLDIFEFLNFENLKTLKIFEEIDGGINIKENELKIYLNLIPFRKIGNHYKETLENLILNDNKYDENILGTTFFLMTKFHKRKKISLNRMYNLKSLKFLGKNVSVGTTSGEIIKHSIDLTQIRYLNISGTNIHDLSPLRYLVNLEKFISTDKDGNFPPITNISPLSECKLLESIDIRRTRVQSILRLSNLQYLKYLNVEDCENITVGMCESFMRKNPIVHLYYTPSNIKIVYYTRNNGAHFYEIIVHDKNVKVHSFDENCKGDDGLYLYVNEIEHNHKIFSEKHLNLPYDRKHPIIDRIVEKVFVGHSPLEFQTEYSGGFGKNADGNSFLLKIDKYIYIYIGGGGTGRVFEFKTDSEIIRYVSPLGNSSVPYPYAVDSKCNIYLFEENTEKKKNVFVKYENLPGQKIDHYIDAYNDFWDAIGFDKTPNYLKHAKQLVDYTNIKYNLLHSIS